MGPQLWSGFWSPSVLWLDVFFLGFKGLLNPLVHQWCFLCSARTTVWPQNETSRLLFSLHRTMKIFPDMNWFFSNTSLPKFFKTQRNTTVNNLTVWPEKGDSLDCSRGINLIAKLLSLLTQQKTWSEETLNSDFNKHIIVASSEELNKKTLPVNQWNKGSKNYRP